MRVKIREEVAWEKRSAGRLAKMLERITREMLPGRDLELSVALVGRERIEQLNIDYRGVTGVTDVLAFPMLEDEGETCAKGRPEQLGDIVICMPVADEQATQRGVGLRDEVDVLAVHGLLHLLGYRDDTEDESKRMLETEERLLGHSIDG